MTARLADRLRLVRRQYVVGREEERALFRSAVTAPALPFHVLHVCGPGGIGKTTLLHELLDVCAHAGVAARCVDARDVDPTPAGFVAAAGADDAPAAARRVLRVDAYETLRPPDGWLRERTLPGQPEDILVAHRAALDACALVPPLTESLLAGLLAVPDAHALYEWLHGPSFVEAGPRGLVAHDLARAVLADYVRLHRDDPSVGPFVARPGWPDAGGLLADALRPADVPALVAMTARHEGDASAAIAARWLARLPDAAVVVRVSFSTFRRHLKAAAARVADVLWQWELDPAAGPAPEPRLPGDPPVLELSRGAAFRRPLALGG